MEKATLTISLPRTMKNFIEGKILANIPLAHSRRDMMGKSDVALLIRRSALPGGAAQNNGPLPLRQTGTNKEKATKHAAMVLQKPLTLDGFMQLGSIVRKVLQKQARGAT
jgi:hypothetical protein